ncbi:hypothetical protein LZW28_04275 [Campylobacter coli]|nr:hypothetical protein [Campylobacter coli]MCE7098246.1 hypothetical protein [Campylobacter coli]MCH3750396.1 hypothetical protein [Campylobacter coli]
MDRMPQ